MARERYLINQEEETIHAEVAPETPSDKRKNWWYYNKFKLLAVLIILVIVVYSVFSIVTRTKPDYQISLLTSYPLPTETLDDFGEYLSGFGEDLNGDGKVVVYVSGYNFTSSAEEMLSDRTSTEAAFVRFTADISTGETMIFLHDERSFNYMSQTSFEGLWRYTNGEDMPSDKTDYENAMLSWSDVKAFADYVPKGLSTTDAVTSEDLQRIFDTFRVSRRSITNSSAGKKESVREYYEACDAFYERLIKGERVNNTGE